MSSVKLQSVKSWLASKHIKVIDNWLTECVDYFVTENPNISLANLQNSVYEQWKLSDLCDIGIPCLPQIIISKDIQKRDPLEGCYVLQLQSVLDISVPAYNQLDQIYKIARHILESDEDRKEKSSRMLKLELTDGAAKIEASEYHPINCLKSTLMPGTKVLLKGPIKMSYNGILILKEGNISVLGGEVECLLECNSLINTLLKSIGLSPNDNPYKPITITQSSQTQISNTISSSIRSSTVISEITPRQDDLISQELDALDDFFLDDDDNFLEINEAASADRNIQEKSILNPNYAIKYRDIPLVYIKQLNEVSNKIENEMKFIIIIQIQEFLEKLCIRNGEWQNMISVTDYFTQDDLTPEDTLIVKLHSDVINNFTGYSRTEMLNLINQIGQDPKIKQDIINHLAVIKEAFETKIYIAHVNVSPSYLNQLPVIITLEELKNEHMRLVESKRNFD